MCRFGNIGMTFRLLTSFDRTDCTALGFHRFLCSSSLPMSDGAWCKALSSRLSIVLSQSAGAKTRSRSHHLKKRLRESLQCWDPYRIRIFKMVKWYQDNVKQCEQVWEERYCCILHPSISFAPRFAEICQGRFAPVGLQSCKVVVRHMSKSCSTWHQVCWMREQSGKKYGPVDRSRNTGCGSRFGNGDAMTF